MNQLTAGILLALSAGTLYAQEQTSANEPDFVGEPMLVTASRVAQTVDQTLASVTVIDRPEIEASQALDVMSVLRLQTGVDVARTGGPGSQTSVFLRGTNSNHALVLIDGVRVTSVHTGAFAWENLPLSQIERIEIVRGPRASFYGSDAIGGVIQIFTRKANAFDVQVTAGGDGLKQIELAGGGAVAGGRYWIAANQRDYDGFSSQNESGFSFDPDDDGFDQTGLNVGFERQVGGNHLVRVSGRASDSEVEFDQGVTQTRQEQLSLRLEGQLTQKLNHSLLIGYATDDTETPAFFSQVETERNDVEWSAHYSAGQATFITTGFAYVEEDGVSTSYSGDRENIAGFLGAQTQLRDHDFQISTRYDDNSEFGSEWTGQAAWGVDLNDRWRTWASYGEAFRAPNLSEQLSPGFGGQFAGNPDLQPESSQSAELGVKFRSGQHRSSLSLFDTDITNLIAFAGVDFQAINIAEANIQGVELQYGWANTAWQADVAFTWQDTETGNGTPLLRRPDEKLGVQIQRKFTWGNLGVDALYASERQDFGVELDAYTLVNLRGSWQIRDNWHLEARLENLTDEDYQLAAGFNTPDRTGHVTLRWSAF